MLKADLHIHTLYSSDCDSSLQNIIERCLKIGINCIAIADHGTIEGALKLKEIAPFTVIVAEEVLTPYGEIMGMFLTERIPSNISVEETIQRIKSQHGLICIPHPYDTVRPSAFRSEDLKQIMEHVDIIEAFNARSFFNHKAKKTVKEYSKLASAGSDAHTIGEIGNAYIEMPEFISREDFIISLSRGRISGAKSSPFVHFSSTYSKLKKRLSFNENK